MSRTATVAMGATLTVVSVIAAGMVSAFATAAGVPSFFRLHSSSPGCAVTWSAAKTQVVRNAEFYAVAAAAPDDAWAVGGPASGSLSPTTSGSAPALTAHWDGVRWESVPNPLKVSVLEGVAAISRDDAWVVGQRAYPQSPQSGYGNGAVAAHWDGTRWRRILLPPLRRLSAVAATSPGDVWAVGVGPLGSAVVVRWDGKRWQTRLRLRATELRDVSALSSTDVWVAGDRPGGRLIEAHWDGRRWMKYSQPPPNDGKYGVDAAPELVAIDAVAADDVWAAGDAEQAGGPAWPDTVLFHWAGTQWQKMSTPQLVWVKDLAARVPGDLWLATITGNGDAFGTPTLERRLRTAWTQQTLRGGEEVTALSSDQAHGLWAVGEVGSNFNALGFPQHKRPLITHGQCR